MAKSHEAKCACLLSSQRLPSMNMKNYPRNNISLCPSITTPSTVLPILTSVKIKFRSLVGTQDIWSDKKIPPDPMRSTTTICTRTSWLGLDLYQLSGAKKVTNYVRHQSWRSLHPQSAIHLFQRFDCYVLPDGCRLIDETRLYGGGQSL